MRIGMVGLGRMGAPLALWLLEQGVAVRARSGRSAEGVRQAAAAGAQISEDWPRFAADLDVALTCLPDTPAVAEVHAALRPHLPKGALLLDLTTGLPADTRPLAALAEAAGFVFADAPVTGMPSAARAGQLVSMVGCRDDQWAAVSAVTGLYSKASHRFGAPGAGHAAKLVNNTVTQGTIALLADAFALARSQDVDLEALGAVLTAGAARSGMLAAALPSVLAGPADGVAFAIAHSAKDLAYAQTTAGEAAGPMLRAAAARLAAAVAAGHGDRVVSELLGTGPAAGRGAD